MRAYTIKPSPLTGQEQLVSTTDARAIKLLRSLRARHAPAHGYFLRPARVRYFEALLQANATPAARYKWRFPDGRLCDIYQAARYMRCELKRRVSAL